MFGVNKTIILVVLLLLDFADNYSILILTGVVGFDFCLRATHEYKVNWRMTTHESVVHNNNFEI